MLMLNHDTVCLKVCSDKAVRKQEQRTKQKYGSPTLKSSDACPINNEVLSVNSLYQLTDQAGEVGLPGRRIGQTRGA
jgi:hypothetical protein